MKKMLIAFATMSGNTEDIARLIENELKDENLVIHLKTLEELQISEIQSYDLVAAGTYTWGDGDLPYEIEDLAEEWAEADFSMVKSAFFGSGDRSYPKFCEAAAILSRAFKRAGADVFPDILKVELSPDDDTQQAMCRTFAKSFIKWTRAEEDAHRVS
ncbi:flavodoxin domain-containing protein [Metabacillus sp. 113a]|uniref:flavodoxin domain-containing protein n=1 Tax=Metabacillus sp. 113a TaxID=3404706 RepID=UPI003CF2FE9A